jgi:hypothetical protein
VRPVPLVAAVLLALVAGYAGGVATRSWGRDEAAPERPRALERAWRAHESGDASGVAAALGALDRAGLSGAHAAEVEYLEAARSGDARALEAVARTRRGTPMGARAAWDVIERAAPEERARLVAAFRETYPRSWLLRSGAPLAGAGLER